jgi:hypothetical protein
MTAIFICTDDSALLLNLDHVAALQLDPLAQSGQAVLRVQYAGSVIAANTSYTVKVTGAVADELTKALRAT